MIICRTIGFVAGIIITILAMYYLTWGDMGISEPGDLWGLTRIYSLMGGCYGAWLIGNWLAKKIGTR